MLGHGISVWRSSLHDLGGASGPAFLPKFNAGLAARAAGTRNAKILMIGDSTTAGWGGSNTAQQTNSIAYSLPRKWMSYFPFGSDSSWFGDKNTLVGAGGTVPLNTFDNRVSSLGSWVQTLGGTATLGGPMLTCASGTSSLVIVPNNVVDTFDVYTRRDASLGTFNINIDGGANTLIDQTVSPGTVQKTTITATAGIHTLNLARVSGSVDLVGVVAYNSAQKEVTIINAGWSGSKAADWQVVSGPQDPLLMIPVIAPDLTVINLTINDWQVPTNIVAYTASMQAIITAAVNAGSDVVLMTGAPSDTALASAPQQQTFIDAIVALGVSNNVPVLNMTTQWTSYAVSNAAGWMFDGLHPNGLGYSQIPAALNTAIHYSQTFSAEASAVFAAFTTPPTSDRKAIINYTIDQFKQGTVWSDLDIAYFEAAADSQAASINWKAPASFALVAVGGGATFTADQGFAGNGTSTAMRTQWIPSVNGVNYTQNNASLWEWSRSNAQQAGADMGNNTTTPLALLVVRVATNTSSLRMNDATALFATGLTTSSIGLFGGQRTASNARRIWKGSASLVSDSQASTGVPTTEQWLCASNSGTFSTNQMAFNAWGASLNGKETRLFFAVRNYLQFLGAF